MLRYLTAGESHGPAVVTVIDGIPAGLPLTAEDINADLARRQRGYGRGGRMQIERDRVDIAGGVRRGQTTGAPIALVIPNRDYDNWRDVLDPRPASGEEDMVSRPRPGHADLAGALKYRLGNLRDVIERASARETAARTAAGAVARRLLEELDITITSFVTSIGAVEWEPRGEIRPEDIEDSPLRCPDPEATRNMVASIDQARRDGDSLGGCFVVTARGVPVGLGSYAQADRKLDGQLAAALMSINGIKGVEVGLGFGSAIVTGSRMHDPIIWQDGYRRETNHAGGIEGGMSNGEALWLRAAMKPIPTLCVPLSTVDMEDHTPAQAHAERSDVCAVPAAAVVGEAVVAWTLATCVLEKFGGDNLLDVVASLRHYAAEVKRR